MPYQNVPEDMQDKMESCVMQVMDKGQDKESAIAICYASLMEGKTEQLDELELNLDDFDALKGGPTSGNWGHAGRPGERGGSAAGGGHGAIGLGGGSVEERLSNLPDTLANRATEREMRRAQVRGGPQGKDVKLSETGTITAEGETRYLNAFVDSRGKLTFTGDSTDKNKFGIFQNPNQENAELREYVADRVEKEYMPVLIEKEKISEQMNTSPEYNDKLAIERNKLNNKLSDIAQNIQSGWNKRGDADRVRQTGKLITSQYSGTDMLGNRYSAGDQIYYSRINGIVKKTELDAFDSAPAVKVAGDWELDVLAIPWGKDSDGQWFDDKTDLMLSSFKTPAVIYYHGVEPSGKALQSTPAIIGKASEPTLESDGWHVRVILDKTKDLAKRVWDAAKQGLARASSGAISHLARLEIDGKTHPYDKSKPGRIASWPFAELSLFDAVEGRTPANRHAIATPTIKTIYNLAGLTLPEIAIDETGGAPVIDGTKSIQGVNEMNEEIEKLVADILAKQEAARAAKAEADKAQAQMIADAVKAERAKWEADAAKANRLPTAPYVAKYSGTRRYDNYTPGDLSFAAQVMLSKEKQPSENLLKSLALKMENDKDPNTALPNMEALKSAGIKADETDYTTNSGYGSDWVGVAYGSELWLAARSEANVAGRVPVGPDIPQGFSSIVIPLESTDPTFYKVPEATDSSYNSTTKIHDATVPPSPVATANKTISVGKMGTRVIYTGELEEDSLVSFAANARRQMGIAAAEVLDYLVINGDTETGNSANINAIDTTPAATAVYLITNGFRKLPLVTLAANSRSASGSLDITDFIETVRLMGTAGRNAMNKSLVDFIVDLNTYWKVLNLPEVLTRDVNSQATIENGNLTRMYGYGVIPSGFMHGGVAGYASTKLLANTAGKVDADTEANNLYGAILAVRWDQWQIRYKRRWTIETVRRPESDTNEIVGLTRVGMGYRDNEASAITYYVGV